MPTGIIVNSASILLGGALGGLAGHHLSERFKRELMLIFGVCSMGMGINAITSMVYMPAVIFAIVFGTAVGLALHLKKKIDHGASYMQKGIAKIVPAPVNNLTEREFITDCVTVIVLFCASGTGIYGALESGMTGDHTVLISKSILDFFTAAIFACHLGYVVSLIAVPQFLIMLSLFLASQLILPLTTPEMLNDFRACGGFLIIATGFRIAKIKEFPIADMLPAMVLVMPFSWLWANGLLPFLH